jgi:hypothetical protein
MLPAVGSAEIYKYRDANGVLRFTDNLAEVPPSQRPNVQSYQEIKTTTIAAEETAAEPIADLKNIEEQLLRDKAVLDEEYTQLTELRDSLEAASTPKTPEEIAVYEKQVADYNERLKAYEAKQQVFREKAAASKAETASSE